MAEPEPMGEFTAFLILGALLAAVLWMIVAPIVIAWRERRFDRRRIMADGGATTGTVTEVGPADRAGRQTVTFEFAPLSGGRAVRVAQPTTEAAVRAIGLQAGSSLPVRFVQKSPAHAFSPRLVAAERSGGRVAIGSRDEADSPVYYVTFGPLDTTAGGFPKRGRDWVGPGDVTFSRLELRLAARLPRIFRMPKPTSLACPTSYVRNVEVFGDRLSLEIVEPGEATRTVRLRAVDAREAAEIAARLPQASTAGFAPAMAEAAKFDSTLKALSRFAPVTYALVALNVLAFIVCALNGGGFLTPNTEAMIRFGSDYTPLTLGGEWWRLLTSTFLHFGILHVSFNMFALAVNGAVAERIYGSTRYLVIYLSAGMAGSVASLWWHPIVNGAGASGAIFGVFGALLAFFVRNPGGIPVSVLARQRTSIALFIAYNLLNGARIQGIDNAAHLGGLCAGALTGLLLARPLDPVRARRAWRTQWASAVVVLGGAALLIGNALTTGRLRPRTAYDEQQKAVPRAAPGSPHRSFGGVSIGMALADVRDARGEPIVQTHNCVTYNSLDAAHDGLLDVCLAPDAATGRVYSVLYSGDAESAPRDLDYLAGLSTGQLIARFGEPLVQSREQDGVSYWQSRTGVVAIVRNGRVVIYGIRGRAD